MSKKVKSFNASGGLVYSTDPNFKIEGPGNYNQESLPPAQQKLKILLDKKQRAGKKVTLIEGFTGSEADREDLGKKLKTFCGTGGSVKDGEIMVQGDNRDKVMQWLQKSGYSASKKV